MDFEKNYPSFEIFSKAIADYIDYYNNRRIQAKTKWMPPLNSGKHPCLNLNYSFFIQCPENWVHIRKPGRIFISWIINELIPSYASSVSDRDLLMSHSIFASGS